MKIRKLHITYPKKVTSEFVQIYWANHFGGSPTGSSNYVRGDFWPIASNYYRNLHAHKPLNQIFIFFWLLLLHA